MNVTESRFKNRQLHIEDYLQMVSAEQKEYAEVFDYSKITEKSGVITDYWTNNLLDLILRKDNLNNAYKQVKMLLENGESLEPNLFKENNSQAGIYIHARLLSNNL